MDRSRQSVRNYLNDAKRKVQQIIKCLDNIINQLYEVEMVKPEIEHRKPINVGFFNLQYAKQRLLNFTTISSKSFVTLTSMKNLKWIQTPFT